ncbi:restriction endonuclease subunit S [Flavobacterium lacus]|uniref:Type I restriction enzyme S subunit n=1 Tax=Flavobacterium lacus TaxID=1353778 RepID=A0A328WXJ3_9FLAO|nr:restriction endonuclease subunit S [Flavobacterium lacus]RAR51070.1 type I restriction enzyme S subunit [Flavobacterium lacus]
MNTTTQHKTSYKNSPLGLIPKDWEVKKIGKIAKTTAGGTPSTHKLEYWNGDIKWMSSGDLNFKRIYDVKGRITVDGLKNSSTKVIPSNCVLIGLAGQGKTRGTVAMNMVELCTNQSVAAILPSKEFYEDYLYHNLDYRYFELRQLSTGDGGRGGLNLNIINSISVPIPPFPEQTAIANCLSTWDKAIEKQNALIAQKELAKKALMQQLLSGKKRLKGFSGEWKEVRLGEISKNKGEYGINAAAVEFDDKLPAYIRITDIDDDGNFSTEKKKSVDDKKSKNFYLNTNDLVFARTGATVGKSYLYNENDGELVFAGFLIRFKIDPKKADSYFIWSFTKTKLYWDWVTSVSMRSGQPGINSQEYSLMKINLPSIAEQTAIAKVLQCADDELQLLKKKLEQLKEQKKGLMQVLLTGKKRLKF